MCKGRLVCGCAGGLDGFAPAVDVSIDQGAELFGAQAVGFSAEVGDLLLDFILRKDVLHIAVHAFGQFLGQALGADHAVPGLDLEVGVAQLMQALDAGELGRSVLAGNGQGLDLAAVDLGLQGHGVVNTVLHFIGHQRNDQRGRALVGDVGGLGLDLHVEHLGNHMLGRACTGRAEVHLVSLDLLHQLFHGVDAGGRTCHQQEGGLGDGGDGGQVSAWVVGHALVQRGRDDHGAAGADQEGATIGLGAADEGGGDIAVGTGLAFNDDAGVDAFFQLEGHDARQHVAGAARSIGLHQGDGLGRPWIFRVGQAGQSCSHCQCSGGSQNGSSEHFHSSLLGLCLVGKSLGNAYLDEIPFCELASSLKY